MSNKEYIEYAKDITSEKSKILQALTVDSKLTVIKRLFNILENEELEETIIYEIIDVTDKIMNSIQVKYLFDGD